MTADNPYSPPQPEQVLQARLAFVIGQQTITIEQLRLQIEKLSGELEKSRDDADSLETERDGEQK